MEKTIKQKVDNRTVLEILKNNGEVSNIGLFVQIILISTLLILFLMNFFIPEISMTIEIVLALSLFATAYNNHTIFRRKYFTVIYVVAGILVILATVYAAQYGI